MTGKKKRQHARPTNLEQPIEVTSYDDMRLPNVIDDGIDGVIRWWEDYARQTADYIFAERTKKFFSLFEHYGVATSETNLGLDLAWKMANDLLPGFKVVQREKTGRKSIWTVQLQTLLWWQVREIVKVKGCSERNACKILLSREPWLSITNKEHNRDKAELRLRTFYKRYGEAKTSPFVGLFEKVLAAQPSANTEKTIDDFAKKFIEPWSDPLKIDWAKF